MSLCPSLAAQWLSIGETVVHHQLCIADLVQTLSQVCGVISVSCWLCALTPQIYLNWRRKSAESLSVGFIFIWLSGDITNLVGCFLTDQLLFQKLLGCYFCFIDSVLCSQLFYYHQRQSRLERSSIEPCTPSEQSRLLEVDSLPKPGYPDSPIGPHRVRRWWRVLLGLFVAGLWATLAYHHGPALVQTWTVGDVIAWLSCILYVTSRLPQIWKNYQRQSVQGLSLFMFFFALNGNLFYFCSILLRSYVSPPGLLRKSLPYIIGSVGTVLQDCTIFAQWYRYTAQSSSNAEDSTA
ncbi:PQ loop repeat-containing protein 2, partial [Dispira parvispora]